MSSPNEPGGNGAASNDVPPWQRGPAGRAARAQQPAQPAPQDAPATLDDRLNRFMAGGSAPAQPPSAPAPANPAPAPAASSPAPAERAPAARPEAYASELPDLSGPLPRPPQQPPRKPAAPERPAAEPAGRAQAQPTTRLQVGSKHKGPVRATMQIRRVDPWSTLKVSLVLSVALFFVWMIAVAFLYLVLGGMGVWSKLNSNVGDLLTSASGSTGGELVSSGTIFGGAALIGLVNIVLLTAMATAAAFIYNLTTDLVGGVEVTLADRD